jgi:succinoglycan biosynthesis transport protein ExoP
MDNADTAFELRQYLEALSRRKWIIVIVIVATVGGALALSLRSDKVYSASSEILLSDPGQGGIFNANPAVQGDPARQVDTQIQLIKSRPIAEAANRQLGARARLVRTVHVGGVAQTDIVKISVESTVPAVARDAADVYADVYVRTRRTQAVDSLLAAANEVQTKLTQAKSQLDDLEVRLSQSLAASKPDQGAIDNLRTQRDAVVSQYTTFKQQYDQVQVDAALARGGAQLVAKADLPTVPVKPTPLRSAVLAFALGLMLGTGLAFVVEHLDDTIKSTDNLERYRKGLSYLGAIPAIGTGRKRDSARVIALDEPSSAAAEAYRALRTSVQIVGLRQPVQTLLVTSPASAEGKTTTLVNLGVTLARQGKRVALVDLDLRRPRIAEYLGLRNDVGFMSVLLGEAPLSEALQEIPVRPGGTLHVLGSGPLPPNPSEVLGTQRVTELLRSLQANVDFVLVDSPPLLPVTDSLVLSRRVDGVIVVAWPGRTRRNQLSRALQMLGEADAPVVGLVMNGTVRDTSYYGYHGYGDGITKSRLPRPRWRERDRQDESPARTGV